MKIVGIIGSKRKRGNTAVLVQEALQAAQNNGARTETIFLGDYSLEGCKGCEGCKSTLQCVINDDMQKIYPLLWEADALILGSPTYFYNVSADMKTFIDRCYCLEVFDDDDRSCWLGIHEVLGTKYAAVIAVCEQAEQRDMGFAAEAMCQPLEALGYRVVDTVKAMKLFDRGDALHDSNALRQSRRAGEKLVKMIKLHQAVKLKATVRDH